MTDLILHTGGKVISRGELATIEAPERTATWFPRKHIDVLNAVESAIAGAGFTVAKAELATAHDGKRFFGTLNLSAALVPGVTLAVGIRNSNDKTFPFGFCAGHRTFVCDNLAFRSDLMVSRKHTRFGTVRFEEAIALAVQKLGQFQAAEKARIEYQQATTVGTDKADALILRAFEEGIVNTRQLPDVIHEWREPRFADFQPRTVFSLLSAFTTIWGHDHKLSPQDLAGKTMRLQRLIAPADVAL
jgi:hypothetical protein